MIRDRAAYEKLCEREQNEALASLTAEESIALLEALLTSEIMDYAVFADDDHPVSLARSLRIGAHRRA